MAGLKSMKIRTKLSVMVGIVVVAMVICVAAAYSALNEVAIGGSIYNNISQDNDLRADILPPPLNIIETRLTVYMMLDHMGDKDQVRRLVAQFEDLKKQYFDAHDKWAKALPEGEIRELIVTKAHDPILRYFQIGETRLIPAITNGNRAGAQQAISEMIPLYNSHWQAMDEANKLVQQNLDAEMSRGRTSVRNSLLELFGISLVVAVIVTLLGFFLARGILHPLQRTVTVLQALAEGDLRQHLEVETTDEVGMMGNALNAAITDLAQTIQSLAGSAEHVASASEEISSTAAQASHSAVTQKDQATQVAAAMQQMSSTVVQVSENAAKASEGARRAGEVAHSGGLIVDETVTVIQNLAASTRDTAAKIQELGKSSDQIGQIIGVIDDIADQTNLLALNAAIEAARAGEQGRGFAVVADEVRKLAERTTQATKEIAQMIKTIQQETQRAVEAMESGTVAVERGVESATKAGNSLKEIIQSSGRVNDLIMHIATAASQQSTATQQVTSNMEQIANLVQESSVGAEQSAKACRDLSDLALGLQRLVGRFKVGDSGKTHMQHRDPRVAGTLHVEPGMPVVPNMKRQSSMTVQ